MNTKLTLNVNESIVEEAKAYAKSHRTSLSKLVENYLNILTHKEKEQRIVTPIVESLTGVIPSDTNSENYKQEYYDYLQKKYS
ncbi:DUF6364 family protein [Petrimonas sp.]|uniref:DUF6364 family protein n=1 Tax=Petrimonas sp. TaxID=2023866 RepID=UPI003F516843